MKEIEFRAFWVSMLWHAMRTTGKGYHRPAMRRVPPKGASHWRGERRADKVEGPLANAPKWLRSYEQRYACPQIRLTEKSARRQSNLMKEMFA
jgi:hypothetical protein